MKTLNATARIAQARSLLTAADAGDAGKALQYVEGILGKGKKDKNGLAGEQTIMWQTLVGEAMLSLYVGDDPKNPNTKKNLIFAWTISVDCHGFKIYDDIEIQEKDFDTFKAKLDKALAKNGKKLAPLVDLLGKIK